MQLINIYRKKQRHNQKAMQKLSSLLSEGGKIVFVAPSGGRDRRNDSGQVQVAPFNAQSIEMFYLMAQRSGRTIHFMPLTLDTYNILPPPDTVEKQLGEKRLAKRSPVHMAFGTELDMQNFPGNLVSDKKQKRENRSKYIWEIINKTYQNFRLKNTK